MLARTTHWLVGQQAADGSWAGDRSEFFSFQTSLVRNTAFVAWALASSGYQGPEITKGLAYVKANLGDLTKADAYSLGLVGNALLTAAPSDPLAGQIIDRLVATGTADGDKLSWDTGGTQTNFYGQGQDGAVATTGLVARALMLAGGHGDVVGKALAFLTSSRDATGNFGSTQATIWALRALLLAATLGTDGAVGSLDVAVDGTSFGQVALTKDQSDVMTTVDLGTLATVGTHAVALTFSGTGKVSYNVVSQYNVPWSAVPVPPAPPAVGITVAYDKTQLALNDVATETVAIKNNTTNGEDMLLVTVGVPPGFQVQTGDLDAYKTQGVLSAYELTGQQLILYVPSLAAGTSQTFAYHLLATMPVKASDGGAVVALYYQPDQKSAAQATTLEVVAGAM
jgi:alpha-2-macroglobulin-like protein